MSYVRLIRLPPHSKAKCVARCWGKQLASRGDRVNNIPEAVESPFRPQWQHRNLGAQVEGNALGVLPGPQDACRNGYHEIWFTATKPFSVDTFENVSISKKCISKSGLPYLTGPPLRGTRLLSTASTSTSLPTGGVVDTGSVSRTGGSRTKHLGSWQQSLRGFSSTPPEQADPKEYFSRRTLLPEEKGLGGPLKPSDKEIEPVKDESAQRYKDLQEEFKLYQAVKKNPRKASEQLEQSQTTISQKKAMDMVKNIPGMTWDAIKTVALFMWEVMKNPRLLQEKLTEAQHHLVEFGRHYWLGSKLLWNDIKTARKIMMRILQGHHMTRRERKQLLRTVSDIFRMVPLAAFVLIPFMEFLLPVALKVFPNMLPSTFQDNLKEEEKLKKELRLRMSYAGFLQETVTAMAVKKKTRAEDGGESEATTSELTEFIEKAKMGEITNQDIPKFAKMFKDELTLDNISRSGLVNMCRYMGLPGFGSDSFLRFQLRSTLRAITEDDQRILWDGVANLTKQELQEACRERGMRATGLTKQGYLRQLSQWLDLSTKKSVPISLLIMSRAFTLQAPDPARALAQSISAMDEDVVTEVMIEAASSEELKTPEYRTRKLESLTRQNELIEEENKKRQEAKQAQDDARKVKMSVEDEDHTTAETKQDEAVNKAVEQAAFEAAARASHGEALLPNITMREGQKEFAATSTSSWKEQDKEPVLTEANIVAPTSGVEAGDRKSTGKQGLNAAEQAKVRSDSEQQQQQHKEGAENGGSKLTAAELDALGSLASPSSVEKEKAQLAMMKAALQESLKDSLGQADEAEEDRIKAEGEKTLTLSELEDGVLSSAASSASSASTAPTSFNTNMKNKDKAAAKGGETEHGEQVGAQLGDTAKDTESKAQTRPETTTKMNVTIRAPQEMDAIEAMPSDSTTSESKDASEVEGSSEEQPVVDKNVQRVQNTLASMLDRLEVEIETVEKRIGDKMHVLDRDKDGMCSAEEIAYVVQHVLTSSSTAEEAKAIAGSMDTDSDGQISVAELIAWVKKHSEQDPEDVFNQLYKRDGEASTKKGSTKPSPDE